MGSDKITIMLQVKSLTRNLLAVNSIFLLLATSCSKGSPGHVGTGGSSGGDITLPVEAVAIQPHKLRRTIESVGSLYPLEEVVVSSEVEGKCERVLVDVGDRVSKGQVLVEISPIELELAAEQQRAELEQARARLGLSDTDSQLQDVTEAAVLKKAAAELADAQQKFQRARELSEEGLLPRQGYEEAESRYKAAQANYDLALQEVRNLQAALKQYRASTELAQKKLRDASIRAPFDGYVKERSVTVGQYLRVQTPVMTIVDTNPLRARLKVPEKMAGWILVGQPVSLSVEAYPDRSFSGKLLRINPSVDPQTRTFEVEALVDNGAGLLKPGFFVKADITSSKEEEVLLVPRRLVHYLFGLYRVYRLNGNTVEEREIKMGEQMGDNVEIVEGLSADDRLASSLTNQPLRDGASVEIVQ